LHACPGVGGELYLFVTDYSSHLFQPSLPSGNAEWSSGLDGHILKVVLPDEREDTRKTIVPGCFCVIRELRIKKEGANSKFYAGYSKKPISQLRDGVVVNMELKLLLA
jgi:hypothetical protein